MEKLKSQIASLPHTDQAELCRWLLSEILGQSIELSQLEEAAQRIKEIDAGEVEMLSHTEFWARLDEQLIEINH